MARNITGATGAALALEDASGTIACVASAGQGAPPVGAVVERNSGIAGLCIRSQEAQLCTDAENDPRVHAETCRDLGVRSLLLVPVLKDGVVIGLMSVYSPEPSRFERRHIAALDCLQIAIPALLVPPHPAKPPAPPVPAELSADAFAASPLLQKAPTPKPPAVPVPKFGITPPAPDFRRKWIPAGAVVVLLVAALVAWFYANARHTERVAAMAQTNQPEPGLPAASPPVAPAEAQSQVARPTTAPAEAEDKDAPPPAPASSPMAGDLAIVQDVHYIHLGEGRGRIIVMLDRQVAFKGFRLINPERLYFDLYHTKLENDSKGDVTTVADDGLHAIRTSQYQADVVRVVLDVAAHYDYAAKFVAEPARLIIDLTPANQQSASH